jgi:hypothetical protein
MYRARLESDGLGLLVPEVYGVPDEIAREGAIADGIPAECIVVTGQPAFAGAMPKQVSRLMDAAVTRLLFVSEPVQADHGSDNSNPHFRGYTEEGVLRLLCHSLQPRAAQTTVHVLPHPRQSHEEVARIWAQHRGALQGEVVQLDPEAAGLSEYDGITGMASVLLYRAWLVGRPVLSIQPGLRLQSLRQLARRPGVLLLDKEDPTAAITAWAAALKSGQAITSRPEIELHRTAAQRVVNIAIDLCRRRDQRIGTTP